LGSNTASTTCLTSAMLSNLCMLCIGQRNKASVNQVHWLSLA
jgi:hypothetical protein